MFLTGSVVEGKLLLALTLQTLIKLRERECKVEILSCISTSQ